MTARRSFDGVPEMGWALAPLAQGKGLSLRLAEKLGFGDAIEAVYNGGTSLVLRRATPQRG